MIQTIFVAIAPSLIILTAIFLIVKIIFNIDTGLVTKSFILGVISIIPAIIFMNLFGIILTTLSMVSFPYILYKLISAANEEFFKYLTINKIIAAKDRYISAIFVGGGFSLCETLYLFFSAPEVAFQRSYTALPLHIITSLILAKGYTQKRFIFLAVLLHLSYNLSLG